jgi:hypothetical protein
MSALRGTYYYLNNRFTVNRADLTFDNVGGVDPKLDIEAVTRVPRTLLNQSDNQTGQEEIEVTVTGRARQPAITFNSESGADQPTVLRALTYGPLLGSEGANLGTGAASYADNYFTRALNRQLSADLQRALQGWISDVEIARESGGLLQGEGNLVLGLGIPVSRNINVRYRQAIAGTAARPTTLTNTTSLNPLERDVEAEYRINRFFYVSTELTQRRSTSAQQGPAVIAPEFNVNLKARWEY